ncbi:MAG: hypothetical protein AABX23_00250 [Nanoarchaeota archaeon]
MKKSVKEKSYFGKWLWWIGHGALKYIILIVVILILSYFQILYLLWFSTGILFTLFNGQMYKWMVRYSFWLSERIGGKHIAQATKTTFYRRFYRTCLFIAGLMLLDLGITGGKLLVALIDRLG